MSVPSIRAKSQHNPAQMLRNPTHHSSTRIGKDWGKKKKKELGWRGKATIKNANVNEHGLVKG